MARKNAFLTQMQAQHDARVMHIGMTMMQWSTQVATDALVKTLGYGECMGDDPWGEMRILRLAQERLKNIDEIWNGISAKPDADAVRETTDRALEKKIPNAYGPWEERYVSWKEQSLASEVAQFRGKWKRQGLLEDDGGTSKLLRGIADETK